MGNDFSGKRTVPSEMPPVMTMEPWNTATLVHRSDVKSVVTVTVDTLRTIARNQLGFGNTDDTVENARIGFEFRIQSFSVWGVEGKTLTVYPIDLIRATATGTQVELGRFDSVAMKNMYPRVGYVYPGAIRATPFSTSRDKTIKILVIKGDTGTIELHFHVLWRGAHSAELVRAFDFRRTDGTVGVRDDPSEASFQVIDNPGSRLSRLEDMMLRLESRLDST